MILFCEECGTRHDIDEATIGEDVYRFSCQVCKETLMVSLSNKQGGKNAPVAMGLTGTDIKNGGDDEALKILIVDDSKLIRKVLREIIESDGSKKVIGEAGNGKEAMSLLATEHPDVVTLDINMPVMDGITTLKHIMISRPTPTVMISSLTQEGSLETFESLKYGAIDFLPKPSRVKGADLKSQREEILRRIELAAGVQLESIRYLRRPSKNKDSLNKNNLPCRCIAAIGVAEGGYGALLNIVPRLKDNLPAAYVAVMHQAPHHIDGFVRYLDQCSQLSVQRAVDGVSVHGGCCYIAAATEHITLDQTGEQFQLRVKSSPFPAPMGTINMLMRSVAQEMKESAIGVILTGTGDDGVEGVGEIIKADGAVFVQDPKSCLFKDTPVKVAEKYDMDLLVSDKQMAGAITAFIRTHSN